MDARDRFKETLRTIVGPALREHGFKGSGSTWRKRNTHGDWAIVNVQKSAWGFADSVNAYVNLSIVSETFRQFETLSWDRPTPKVPSESQGHWRARLQPPDEDRRWGRDWAFRDGSMAADYGAAMVGSLETRGIPVLERLLDREILLSALRDPRPEYESGNFWVWSTEGLTAAMLSDDGPSDELDAAMDAVRADIARHTDESWGNRPRAEGLLAWIAARLASASAAEVSR